MLDKLGGRDILGNTVYSAKTVVKKALDRIGIPQDSKEKGKSFFMNHSCVF